MAPAAATVLVAESVTTEVVCELARSSAEPPSASGVDLFFALSGFILTITYLTRLGPRLAGGATVNFWWLRLARIYPVHLVMLIVAGVAVVAEAKLAGEDPEPVDVAEAETSGGPGHRQLDVISAFWRERHQG